MSDPRAAVVGIVLVACFTLWFVWYMFRPPPAHRPSPCYDPDYAGYAPMREAFEPPPAAEGGSGNQEGRQRLIDAGDILVPNEHREALSQIEEDAKGIETIEERFKKAKRPTVENRMRNGICDNKERRKRVETLLRRMPCSRRVRSWRFENSDYLRGDVIPKKSAMSNMFPTSKRNPQVDLHPGALGPVAGLSGRWLSEENIPENLFDDVVEG